MLSGGAAYCRCEGKLQPADKAPRNRTRAPIGAVRVALQKLQTARGLGARCAARRLSLACTSYFAPIARVPALTLVGGKHRLKVVDCVCDDHHKIRRDYSAPPNRDGFAGSGLKHPPEVTSMENRIRATAFSVAESNPMGLASHFPLPSREVDGTNRQSLD